MTCSIRCVLLDQGNESELTAERKDSKVFSDTDQEDSSVQSWRCAAQRFHYSVVVAVQQYNAPPRSQECTSVRRTEEGLNEKSHPHV